MGRKLPTSFLPEEDQGYLMITLTLPQSASLQRTAAAVRKVEDIVRKVPGIQSITSIMGFSILSGTQSTYDAIFFVRSRTGTNARHRNSRPRPSNSG